MSEMNKLRTTPIMILLLITSFLVYNASHRNVTPIYDNKATMTPYPSSSSEYYNEFDLFELHEIASDINMKWIYADTTKSCVLGSQLFENSTDDFLKGWLKLPSGKYVFEPINPGEAPALFIHKVYDVRWSVTNGMCKVGIEMDMSENQDSSRHVWQIYTFKHSIVDGHRYNVKPDVWDTLETGIRLK